MTWLIRGSFPVYQHNDKQRISAPREEAGVQSCNWGRTLELETSRERAPIAGLGSPAHLPLPADQANPVLPVHAHGVQNRAFSSDRGCPSQNQCVKVSSWVCVKSVPSTQPAALANMLG